MTITSPEGLEMLEMLPSYYGSSDVMHEILDAQGAEVDRLLASTEEFLNALFVRTAPDWALSRWEAELGLADGTGMDAVDRQDKIIAQLRGFGTATKAMLQRVVSSYHGGLGEVVVEDVGDNPGAGVADYTIRITFVSPVGVPDSFALIEDAVRMIAPAHLEIEYAFNLTTWDELDAMAMTWDEWDTADGGGPYTWNEMEVLI